ncbi:hypothetical protein DSO57_1000259 [Entomophthora muscae]|uniref:Uncharacterized protein n=1 Tax=Entomophthora muscae TaxID=34485 RepID=A0ACC2SYJ1_9FUNG|nr:hypothetical protein DSO57_1000259 [Entomophthora muscae]
MVPGYDSGHTLGTGGQETHIYADINVKNDISILVLKTWESNLGSQKKHCYDQGRQEPARLPVGPNPGPPEISCPNQEEQKTANLPSVNTGGSKSTLETLESNPDPPKAT